MQHQSPMISQMQIISHNYIIARKLLSNTSYAFTSILSVHECTDIVFKVNKAFLSLNDFEKSLINNEFFHQAYSDWWKKKYKKEEFDSLLKKTVQHFLEVYYEII
jgi:hypothetical protein